MKFENQIPTTIFSKYSYHSKDEDFSCTIAKWIEKTIKQDNGTNGIEKYPSIFKYILFYIQTILIKKIKKKYVLHDDVQFQITNISFDSPSYNKNFPEFLKDDSNISCRIPIHNTKTCSMIFDDDIEHDNLIHGSIIIYSNKSNYKIVYNSIVPPVFLLININIYDVDDSMNMWNIESHNEYKDC